jgi:HlyD family secretion protein
MTGRSDDWFDDHKLRLSRGVSTRQSDADEAAFLDGVIPPQERGALHRDVVEPVKNYNSIAVVVGKKPVSQRQAAQKPGSQRPVSQKPVSPRPVSSRPVAQKQRPPHKVFAPKPAPRDPPRPVVARLPALAQTTAVERRAASSVATLRRTYDPAGEAAERDGLKAYLVRSFESQRRAGGRMLSIALVVGGGWASLVPLSGAVVVPGTVVSESSVKKIQHQTGGVISAIAVTDGMRVHEGDVLVRLDETQVRANYDQVRSKIAQLNDEIGGMEAQIKSKKTQADLIIQELDGVQQLWDKRLVPLNRLTGLQREAARIDGEKAQLVSNIAETRGKINEAEVQLVAANDKLSHIDLRAPVNGVVHQLAVHTVGGVVNPAEVVMVIVPEGDELQIDAHLPPDQIDQVHKGQNAQVHFPAFNQRTTPAISGVVTYVSADISRDPQQPSSSPGYYSVRVSLPDQEFARLGDRQLIAGMPAELFIQTGSRTMMSYLFKPITEQLGRMFRER